MPNACNLVDKDLSFAVQDFGPGGLIAPVTQLLSHGLKPGAVLSAVISTDVDMAVNVYDAKKNVLIHVVFRVTKNDFGVNSNLDKAWGVEEKLPGSLVQRGCRFTCTLVHEESGYRIFVNGAEVAFYKHRSPAEAHLVEINGGQTFKLVYLTTRNITPA